MNKRELVKLILEEVSKDENFQRVIDSSKFSENFNILNSEVEIKIYSKNKEGVVCRVKSNGDCGVTEYTMTFPSIKKDLKQH